MRRACLARPVLCLVLCLLLATGTPARALDQLRVGNDAPSSIPNCALDIGIARGIFARHGLEIAPSIFFGSAKGQPALISGAVDVLVGAGSEMVFIARGAPERAVAVVSGQPADMALVATDPAAIAGPAWLKGRRLGISNPGGLTDWLAHLLLRRAGLAAGDVTLISAGNSATEAAMLRTGGLDAAVMDSLTADTLQARGGGHVVQSFGASVPDFAQGVIYARTDLIAQRPEVLRALLAGWFEALGLMLSEPPAAIGCIVARMGADPAAGARVFALMRDEISPDGRFRPAAMAVLAHSFVEMGTLPEPPDMTALYTEAFLPPSR